MKKDLAAVEGRLHLTLAMKRQTLSTSLSWRSEILNFHLTKEPETNGCHLALTHASVYTGQGSNYIHLQSAPWLPEPFSSTQAPVVSLGVSSGFQCPYPYPALN